MNKFFSFFSTDGTYRMGLALSGGGARGFAHCGAIKAMEEMGLKPDIIAGVSAGSVVAVLYAAGKTPDEIINLFSEAKFSEFAKLTVPKHGFFKMDGFKRFLKKNIPYENLEDLPIPTYIGATDIVKGEAVVFDKGPIVDRVVASCSMPIIFPPQKVGNVYYVDGGVTHNLPSWIIRDKCKYLFGVNVSPLNPPRYTGSIIDIAQRSYNLMAKSSVDADRALCDLVVETTDIAHYRVFDLKGIKRVFNAGYKAAHKRLLEAGFTPTEMLKPKRRKVLKAKATKALKAITSLATSSAPPSSSSPSPAPPQDTPAPATTTEKAE